MFSKGDRVMVSHGQNARYDGVEGVFVKEDGFGCYIQVDEIWIKKLSGSNGPWCFSAVWKLELVDEPVVEEDWS